MAATVALLLMAWPASEPKGSHGRHKVLSMLATVTLVLWVGVTFAGRGRWLTLMLMR
jgi:hypothetical protein